VARSRVRSAETTSPVRPARRDLVRISDLAERAGVPAATIKHYMREGLLPRPQALTSRNMAYYDPRLAERVKTIKDLQSRRFLPLKLIGELLEPPPSAALRADAEETLRRHLGDLEPAIRAGTVDARARRGGRPAGGATRAEVLARLAITADELDHLGEAGLVAPIVDTSGAASYSGADLDLLEVIDETRRAGLGDLFPMAILEPYAAAVRTLVRVEIELFRRRVLAGGALPPRPLDEIARDATRLGERLVVAMRAKLVIPELRAAAGAPTTATDEPDPERR
jgi:DNA-binding transcriptional MerR regulator